MWSDTPEFDEHIRAILTMPHIQGRLVILCEGDRIRRGDEDRAASPQTYARHDQMPDSSFYTACIPRDWQGSHLPRFINCGGRSEVLATYAGLLSEHAAHPANSYLAPDKLYAIVDVDLQPASLPTNSGEDTEACHRALYPEGRLHPPIGDHRIWVTALVHKEAYFLLPSVEAIVIGDHRRPHVDGQPFDLRTLLAHAARRLDPTSEDLDRDLCDHFATATARLARLPIAHHLDLADGAHLHRSWCAAVTGCEPDDYERLVAALFTVTKAKPHWHRIEPAPDTDWTRGSELFRDQIALAIARHIATLPPEEHALAGFFRWLRDRR